MQRLVDELKLLIPMPTWNSDQYLKFERERTQPSIDLAARIEIPAPARVIDLGCGPGNSTRSLSNRWPNASISGLDTSKAMLETAKKVLPKIEWVEGDLAQWKTSTAFDVVFSNAAFQWVPNHHELLPHLLDQVKPEGALAFQVPANVEAPPHRLMRDLAQSPHWEESFVKPPREWHVETPSFYYDLLAPLSSRIDLWQTDYLHVVDGPEGIVEWYQGTGLRPWLESLKNDQERADFLAEFQQGIETLYPRQPDGKVLFPFRRLFVIAYKV